MIQSSTMPEYLVEEKLDETNQHKALSKVSNPISLVQVVAELRLLSKELDISVVILGRIRDSVHVLELSVQEHM